MAEILTVAQMRTLEQTAISSGAVTGETLMERAGTGAVRAIFDRFHGFEALKGHAVVLCGPGNNGGDGFVMARDLHARGWTVEVLLWGDPEKLPTDARTMFDRWTPLGKVSPMTVAAAGKGPRPDLLIDAMFGIGINRPIPLECAQAFQAVRHRAKGPAGNRLRIVAVDCPSGFDADSGVILVPDMPKDEDGQLDHFPNEVQPRLLHIPTDLCVTFHRMKIGHCLTQVGQDWPAVVDIGLPKATGFAVTADPDGATGTVPFAGVPQRMWLRSVASVGAGGHKYQRGHVLVLGGGCGKGGAGRLAARAALRVGAGLVTLAVPPEALAENAAHLNAVMLHPLDGAAALEDILQDTRLGVICMGPGLGVGADTRDLVLTALGMTAKDGRRVVLDADALSSFADTPEVLFKACHDRVILTPHEGEFARLFPDLSEKTRFSRTAKPPLGKVAATQMAAKRMGGTILLKGEATVLADARGASLVHSALYDRKAPWLGTAGAGDVLAGMIAGLWAHEMSRGSAPVDLAAAAAWLHVEAARSFGPGLIAEDLPEQLPKVFRDLGFE